MGQNPVPPVNILISTKLIKMGGAPTPKWYSIGFEPQPFVARGFSRSRHPTPGFERTWLGPGRDAEVREPSVAPHLCFQLLHTHAFTESDFLSFHTWPTIKNVSRETPSGFFLASFPLPPRVWEPFLLPDLLPQPLGPPPRFRQAAENCRGLG